MNMYEVQTMVTIKLKADNPTDAARIVKASIYTGPTNESMRVSCLTLESASIDVIEVFKED